MIQVLRQPLARTLIDHISLEYVPPQLIHHARELIQHGVVLIENTGVIQVFRYPVAQRLQLSKIDNKTTFVQSLAPEFKGKAPIMAMDLPAMPVMLVLPVSKGDVGIGFLASKHCLYVGKRQSALTSVSSSGASAP
jgi:hypothetical protein